MKKRKIGVAMSGGIDSSVAAALLLNQGYDVFGITMQHYHNEAYGFLKNEGIEAAIEDARKVCVQLGIKHHVIDVSKDFKAIIEENFINEYKIGRTPNPCTLCNPMIKWGSLLRAAENLGAEKIATGHYIKIMKKNGLYQLSAAFDKEKDQSYMLWKLNQEQLSKTFFPLAKLKKRRIREIGKHLDLLIHDKKESQEICFIKGHYEDYLRKHLTLVPGNIELPGGKVIGTHRGLQLYTIGQRKGINTPWSSPLYVLKLDINRNVLIVTDQSKDLEKNYFSIEHINWIAGSIPAILSGITVQVRYNSVPEEIATIEILSSDLIKIELRQPARAITAGQSAVFYQQDVLLGGGIIK